MGLLSRMQIPSCYYNWGDLQAFTLLFWDVQGDQKEELKKEDMEQLFCNGGIR